jgi:hypothetical protein
MIRDCSGIDINELNQGIYWYRKGHNGDYPSYLIMNNESFYLMKRTIDRSFPLENVLNEGVPTWRGIYIAVCNNLKTGEVDFV